MEYWFTQIQNKDVGKRLQVGPDLIEYLSDRQKCVDLEQDQTLLDKMVDALATSWVNSSNYKVGADLLFHHLLCTTRPRGAFLMFANVRKLLQSLLKNACAEVFLIIASLLWLPFPVSRSKYAN